MPGPSDLNEAAWKDVNEAVGEALGVSPPDPAADRPGPDAPAHGQSPARLVPMPEGGPAPQQKLPDNGVRYQMVSAAELRHLDAQRRLAAWQAEVEKRNREAAARAHPAFHPVDGSLVGEYAPLEGEATTPDTVDAIWWLGLPMRQAMWELGLTNEAEYRKVYAAVEPVALQVENRRRQMQQQGLEPDFVPMVIKRRRNRVNGALFHGGRITRIKPMTDPTSVPPPARNPDGTFKRRRRT